MTHPELAARFGVSRSTIAMYSQMYSQSMGPKLRPTSLRLRRTRSV